MQAAALGRLIPPGSTVGSASTGNNGTGNPKPGKTEAVDRNDKSDDEAEAGSEEVAIARIQQALKRVSEW